MRVRALVIRILRQIIRDKRTLGLLIFAPILILTMLHLVFNGDDYVPKVGLVDIPEAFEEQLDLDDADITKYTNIESANKDTEKQLLDGYITFENTSPSIVLEGSDPNVNGATIKWLQRLLLLYSQATQMS